MGGREDSNVYIRMKIQAAAAVGATVDHIKLPKNTTQQQVSVYILIFFLVNWLINVFQLLHNLNKLNNDPNVHGIIVQMPLDSDNAIDSHLITDSVLPTKDVDG